MMFLNCTAGGKIPGRSIFEAGVAGALEEAGHDSAMFYERGGAYEWRKANILDVEDMAGASSNIAPSLLPPSLQRQGSTGGA